MRKEIHIDEVIAYMNCPVMYMFRYKTGHSTKSINLNTKFDIDMHKLFYNLFMRLQNKDGDGVEVAHLKKAWGKLWLSDRVGYEVVIAEPKTWRDTVNVKRKAGIEAIDHLWKNFLKEKPFDVLVVNQEYEVMIDDIKLKGKWDLIREVENELRVDDVLKNGFFVKNDLRITAASYAFKAMTGYKEDKIRMYRGLKGTFTDTSRDEKDYNLLKHTVKQIVKAIDQDIYYPSITSDCNTCPYRHACEQYLSADVLNTPFKHEGGDSDET